MTSNLHRKKLSKTVERKYSLSLRGKGYLTEYIGQAHWTMPLKRENITLCKLYFNKLNFKILGEN